MADEYAGTNYLPDYASYNWTGGPSDFSSLSTNEVGGDSSTQTTHTHPLTPY